MIQKQCRVKKGGIKKKNYSKEEKKCIMCNYNKFHELSLPKRENYPKK